MKNVIPLAAVLLLASILPTSPAFSADLHPSPNEPAGKLIDIIRVCVYHKKPRHKSDSGGYVEPVPKGAEDSVKDIAGLLADDPTIDLMKMPADADVSIDVVRRQTRASGSTSFIIPEGFGILALVQGTRRVIFATLRAPGYTKHLVGQAPALWTDAAQDVVDQVEQWINLNRKVLVSKRPL